MNKTLKALTLALLLCADALQAGPWPRGEGQTFLSFGTQTSTPRDGVGTDLKTFYTLYLERGLKQELTLGLDAGSKDFGDYGVIVFLRRPIFQNDGPHRLAFQVGVGNHGDQVSQEMTLQTGLSWGRGLETQLGDGWAVADLQSIFLGGSGEFVTKLDVTYGVKPKDGLKLMMQLQSGKYPGSDAYVRLAPSVAWEMRPGRHLELGLQVGLVGDDRVGFKVGSWFDF